MNCSEQILKAIILKKISEAVLKEVKITSIVDCLEECEQKKVKKLSKKFKLRQCLDNACLVMEEIGVQCCEGVAYIIRDAEDNHNNAGWIIHAWNKKGDKYFDVTKEYIYQKIDPKLREINYYLIKECTPSEYKAKVERGDVSGFVSNSKEIETILNEINDETN